LVFLSRFSYASCAPVDAPNGHIAVAPIFLQKLHLLLGNFLYYQKFEQAFTFGNLAHNFFLTKLLIQPND
jgi:hypothetical protein